jgi:CspA family cold shock protein
MNKRENGTVKWYDPVKGYGFIGRDNSNEDIFVHFRNLEIINNLRVELQPDQRVSFIVENGKKGLHAVDVKLI